MRPRLLATLVVVTGLGRSLSSCADPTTIEVSVFSEVPCAARAELALRVASDGPSLDSAITASTATECQDMGDGTARRGRVVLVPDGDKEKPIALQLMTRSDDRPTDDCTVDRAHCIVARRQLRFRSHQSTSVLVDMRLSCIGIVCASNETCVKGACVSSQLPDCDTCGESVLVGPGAPSSGDAGPGPADAGPGPVDAGPPPPTKAPDINGGASWGGWTRLGNSRDPGVYAAQDRTNDFDVYYTSFPLPAAAAATKANVGNALADLSTGSWRAGDLIVGIGIVWQNGQSGTSNITFAKFDRNGTGTFSPSTSTAPAVGNGATADADGGTGYVQFNAVGYRFDTNGGVVDWFMRSPAAPSGASIIPTLVGTTPTSNFLNQARDFWGQLFPDLVMFKQALPFRTYGVANGAVGATIASHQWLVNSSAFDRAGAAYSVPGQSFKKGWGFSLAVGNAASAFSEVVGLKLPLYGQ